MKTKQLIIVCCLFFLWGCHQDKDAQLSLEQARNLYETAQYGSAKQTLDEIKSQYPKEYAVQKEALHLMREIELKEQERNLSFCDSLLAIRQAEANSMKQAFVFEKTEYDSEGRYVPKSWNPAVESGGNFIKTNVTEANDPVLTAVYKGPSSTYFDQLKVSAPSGEYAETQTIPFDGGANYSFKDGSGITYQTVTFQKGRDNGVLTFIYMYAKEKISLEYDAGGKKISSRILTANEKEAVVKTLDLATVLKDIDNLTKEKDKSGKRIRYLQSKLS